MKLRTLFTVMLVIAGLTTVTAQKEKNFEIGAQFGYGSHWIINQNNYGIQEMDYEPYWGSGFNFQAGYNFTENLGLFTEVGVLNQGQKYSDNTIHGIEVDAERTVDLKYLNVPVFFKYSAGNTKAHFRLLAGPQFCFLQKAEQEYLVNGEPLPDEELFYKTNLEGEDFFVGETNIEDRYNSLDVALVIDLGADIFVMENILYLSVGARMFYGLTDINADAYQMKNYDGDYNPSHNAGGTLYFGVHYIINGKKAE